MSGKLKSLRTKFLLIGILIVVLISMVEMNVIKHSAQAEGDKNQSAYVNGSSINDGTEENTSDGMDNKDSDDEVKSEGETNDEVKPYDNQSATQNNEDNIKQEAAQEKKVIEIECLYQGDGYPSGCEIFSTAMLLNYYGYDYSIEDILAVLPMGSLHYEGDERVGPSPNTCFIGQPDTNNGICCYEPVIEDVLGKMASGRSVENATGSTLEELCRKYIDKDIPVVLWAAVGMEPATSMITWRIEGTDEYFSWPDTEHCLLLVGYDKDNYYFNDPMTGELTSYDKSATETRYSELGKQAVTIY